MAAKHLRGASGLTSYAKRNVFAGTPTIAWRLLVDNFTFKRITKCAVTEVHHQLQGQTFAIAVKEMEVFIAVIYAREEQEKVICLCMIFALNDGVCQCAKAMSRNRCCEILRYFRFDINLIVHKSFVFGVNPGYW